MAVPFGFSVGDFIGVIGLVDDVRKVLKDVEGAEDDFQQVLIELQQQELVLHSWVMADGALDVIPVMSMPSEMSRKGSTCVSKSDRGLGRKAQWVVLMQDELTKFQTTITGKVIAMHLLLSIPITTTLSRIESSQTSMENKPLGKIEDCRNCNNSMAMDIANLRAQQDRSAANIARLVRICTGMNIGVNKVIHISQVRSQQMHVALRKME